MIMTLCCSGDDGIDLSGRYVKHCLTNMWTSMTLYCEAIKWPISNKVIHLSYRVGISKHDNICNNSSTRSIDPYKPA